MPEKLVGWSKHPLTPVSQLETTFDHNARIKRQSDDNERDSKLGWWDTWNDGAYAFLVAAHIAYQESNDLLRNTHPYAPRTVRAERERLTDAHWKTFVDLSRLYARMDK